MTHDPDWSHSDANKIPGKLNSLKGGFKDREEREKRDRCSRFCARSKLYQRFLQVTSSIKSGEVWCLIMVVQALRARLAFLYACLGDIDLAHFFSLWYFVLKDQRYRERTRSRVSRYFLTRAIISFRLFNKRGQNERKLLCMAPKEKFETQSQINVCTVSNLFG